MPASDEAGGVLDPTLVRRDPTLVRRDPTLRRSCTQVRDSAAGRTAGRNHGAACGRTAVGDPERGWVSSAASESNVWSQTPRRRLRSPAAARSDHIVVGLIAASNTDESRQCEPPQCIIFGPRRHGPASARPPRGEPVSKRLGRSERSPAREGGSPIAGTSVGSRRISLCARSGVKMHHLHHQPYRHLFSD
jgi:hypothetical protein